MHTAQLRNSFSVIVPVRNERETIAALVNQIHEIAESERLDLTEIIVVDDGSSDGTWDVLRNLAVNTPGVHAIRLRRNFGKATALMTGIRAATSDVIITMDGDLQDDPREIPSFLALIAEGNDLVSGWKKDRKDPLSKTLPSAVFNWVTSKATGIKLHDFNCGYKAYRRAIFDSLSLYGELHRYIPVLAKSLGYRIAELPVRHHPRKFGRSNYGMTRLLKGFIDLTSVLMITRFAHRPGHLFGGIGILLFAIGTACLAYLVTLKLATGASIGGRPLLIMSVFLDIVGLQLILFGMLAELLIKSSGERTVPANLVSEELLPKAGSMQ